MPEIILGIRWFDFVSNYIHVPWPLGDILAARLISVFGHIARLGRLLWRVEFMAG